MHVSIATSYIVRRWTFAAHLEVAIVAHGIIVLKLVLRGFLHGVLLLVSEALAELCVVDRANVEEKSREQARYGRVQSEQPALLRLTLNVEVLNQSANHECSNRAKDGRGEEEHPHGHTFVPHIDRRLDHGYCW